MPNTPEAQAREEIDRQLDATGWKVQDFAQINLGAGLGVAVREFQLSTGPADYMLFIDGRAAGVLEAKPAGHTLMGVTTQSDKYLSGTHPALQNAWGRPFPFAYESTGVETQFRDERDPAPRSRLVYQFHKPETLKEWLEQQDTLRGRLRNLPPLDPTGLRTCQVEAIEGLETSLADDRPKSLIQMATGTGKTYTMVTEAYRLIKYGKAKRVLFLVDRRTLGRQALGEFQNYVTPVEHKKFTDLYNVQLMTSPTLDPVAKVVITTIQRMYGLLTGLDVDDDLDERSLSRMSPRDMPSQEVGYNKAIPPETFDFIVTDECHRSIYGLWLQVLEYFDSFLVGLTATPSKQTLGFFDQNLVMEYTHDRAVADGVNVGYDIYRIKTQITEQGSMVEAGNQVQMRDKQTRQKRWELVDEDLAYKPGELDRTVVAVDQIRTIVQTFRDRVCTELFPGRMHVPKTLVFAKDDSHAEDITRIILEEFNKGNTFCRKITYRTTGDTPENLIKAFRNSFEPRIAVTVDMISTGTDIRPLECLLFMRDVKSQVYYEQMKGRGTRVIDPTDLKAVTPDTEHKTHFVLVDAVGVTETDKTDSQPLERKNSVPFETLLNHVAIGARDVDTLTTLAGRLARLEQALDADDRARITKQAERSLRHMANDLLDAVDPDKQMEHARAKFGTEAPTGDQVAAAASELAQQACQPFNVPDTRTLLCQLKSRSEQTLDVVSADQVLYAGFDTERAQRYVTDFRQFIEAHKDELTALQILYSAPRRDRHVTYQQIRELADAIGGPPHYLVPDLVWQAYQHLDQARVKNGSPQRVLTDIISLVRFATGAANTLEPYPDQVRRRFDAWMAAQAAAGRTFTDGQREWLALIRDRIATSASVAVEDMQLPPFSQKGGPFKAAQLFGNGWNGLLDELNEELAA